MATTEAGLCYSTLSNFSTSIDDGTDEEESMYVPLNWNICRSTDECDYLFKLENMPGDNCTFVSYKFN